MSNESRRSRFSALVWGVLIGFGCALAAAGPSLAAATAAETPGPSATIIGLSGTLLVPSASILEAGGTTGAMHLVSSVDDDLSSIKGAFAFASRLEVSVQKQFSKTYGEAAYEPIFGAKFSLRPDLTLATIIDANPGFRNTVMLLSGTRTNHLTLGVGANVGRRDQDRQAWFGRNQNGRGVSDPLFFLLGSEVKLTPAWRLILDYDGGALALGTRYCFDARSRIDLGYVTRDRHNPLNRWIVGANFGF